MKTSHTSQWDLPLEAESFGKSADAPPAQPLGEQQADAEAAHLRRRDAKQRERTFSTMPGMTPGSTWEW